MIGRDTVRDWQAAGGCLMGQVYLENQEPTANADQMVSNDLLKVIDARWGDTFRSGGDVAFETFVQVYKQHFSRRDRKVGSAFVQFFAKAIPPEQTHRLKTHPDVRYFFLDARDFYRAKLARWNDLPPWRKLFTRRPSFDEIDLSAELDALEGSDIRQRLAAEVATRDIA